MMMKNDYRRALILLRSSLSGVNGHVRLERRTLMGSMQFTVSGLKTDMPLQAAMAAKTAAGWKITHIGTLGMDTRGQAGLNWTFDPRNIEGLPLEKYSVLLVLETNGQTCRAILTGYVNGSVQVDWARVEQAACANYIHTTQNAPDNMQQETAPQPTTDDFDAPAPAADTGEEMDLPANAAAQPVPNGASAETDAFDLPAAQENTAKENTAQETAAQEDTAQEDDVQETAAAVWADPMDVPAREAKTAMEALGLEAGRKWPESIEPLREAFAASAPVFMEEMPDHVFVSMAHSKDCPLCLTGVRAQDGVPVTVAYAIPVEGQERAPAGLEGYMRRGNWWVAVADAQTGAYVHI